MRDDAPGFVRPGGVCVDGEGVGRSESAAEDVVEGVEIAAPKDAGNEHALYFVEEGIERRAAGAVDHEGGLHAGGVYEWGEVGCETLIES